MFPLRNETANGLQPVPIVRRTANTSAPEQLDINGFVSKKFYRDFQLRYIHIWEMHHLLELCGYEIIDLYGDFELTPFDETSTEMVFVVKPRDYLTNHHKS